MRFHILYFIILDLRLTILALSGELFFYALYDSHNPLFPYFVAKHQACRNNSDKYLAFFLESAKNFLTFAMSIRTNDI